MWIPAGVFGAIRPGRRRRALMPRYRASVSRKKRITTTPMKTGRSAITEPQSGITNWDVMSRIDFQMLWSSSIGQVNGRGSVVRGASDEDVCHERHRDPQHTQHREARVVDMEMAEIRQ